MENKHTRCLLLNADYSPIHIMNWKKALTWSMRYTNDSRFSIEIIDFYKDDFIQGVGNKKYPIPAVAKTRKYFKSNTYKLTFSRRNIFLRDNYTCQYCGLRYSINELTYDHVIPKSSWNQESRSSATTWTNIVTACIGCNRKKRNRTPKEANMPLQNLPIIPHRTNKYLPIAQFLHKIKEDIPNEWIVYLPDSYII